MLQDEKIIALNLRSGAGHLCKNRNTTELKECYSGKHIDV